MKQTQFSPLGGSPCLSLDGGGELLHFHRVLVKAVEYSLALADKHASGPVKTLQRSLVVGDLVIHRHQIWFRGI